jgi:hypothetical protein
MHLKVLWISTTFNQITANIAKYRNADDCCHSGCYALKSDTDSLKFQRKVMPLSSDLKSVPSNNRSFDHEDRWTVFFQNVNKFLLDYTASIPEASVLNSHRSDKVRIYVRHMLKCNYLGRGFDTLWGEFLNLPNPSGRTRPWGLLSL